MTRAKVTPKVKKAKKRVRKPKAPEMQVTYPVLTRPDRVSHTASHTAETTPKKFPFGTVTMNKRLRMESIFKRPETDRSPIYGERTHVLRMISCPGDMWQVQRRVEEHGTREKSPWTDLYRATNYEAAHMQLNYQTQMSKS